MRKSLLGCVLLLGGIVSAGNLLPDASFELGGTDYDARRFADITDPRQQRNITPVADPEHPVHGKVSLRFDNPYRVPLGLRSPDIALRDDTTYTLDHNVAYHPFSSFVKMTRLKIASDPYGSPVECPSEIRFFTSDGLFRDIEARRRENRILREEKEAAYKDRREKAGQRYRFSSLEDLDGLKERNAALRSTERQWAERLGKAEEERSNGESSLDVFASILDNPGLYLVDEPENCLSPLNQSRLATLLFDAAFHNRSQLIVASHSPFILAIPGAKVIDLDEEPPREKKWSELPNIRLYRDFFLSHAKDFD